MNTTTLNMTTLDGGIIIRKGEGGGSTPTPPSGGDTSKAVNDVTYYDYDGTVLHSFSADAFATLTEHPALPEREGLVCQGWNYDFAKAQEYVAKYGVLNIGASYITDDGKTRLYIRIAAEGRMEVPLYFSQTVANGVTIDWGDGSATQTLSWTGNRNLNHQYASIGDYCITLSVAEGCALGLGHNTTNYCVLGNSNKYGLVYSNMLQRVEIGESVTNIVGSAFYGCRSLASVVIPDGVTSIGGNAFKNCFSLASIVIPKGVISIGGNAFYGCGITSIVIPEGVTSISSNAFYANSCITSIVIPEGVTSISGGAFNQSQTLASIVIPESVTSIGQQAFYWCYGMAFYDFSALIVVPSLSSIDALYDIPSDCKIIVPDALYDEWIAATNWSTYASQTIKKSDWDALNA